MKTLEEIQKEVNKKIQEVILENYEEVERFVLKIVSKKQKLIQEAQEEVNKQNNESKVKKEDIKK